MEAEKKDKQTHMEQFVLFDVIVVYVTSMFLKKNANYRTNSKSSSVIEKSGRFRGLFFPIGQNFSNIADN